MEADRGPAQRGGDVVVVARSRLLAEALAELLTSRGIPAAGVTGCDLAALGAPAVAVVEAAVTPAARNLWPSSSLVVLVPRQVCELPEVEVSAWIGPAAAPEVVVVTVERLSRGLPAPRHVRARPRPPLGDAVLRHLTVRELQVLAALTGGAPVAVVADQLGIAPHTVRTHQRNLRAKLGVRTTLEAAALGRRAGLGGAGLGGGRRAEPA